MIGLSQRATHPLSQLHLLHGSLFDIRCTDFYCNWAEQNNFIDPIVPSLAIPLATPPPTLPTAQGTFIEQEAEGTVRELDISDERVAIPQIPRSDLPTCPKCRTGLLRPGVVWFGEMLPSETISAVDKFIDESLQIDLMLVIGTSSRVYPAAGYVEQAREKGARIAVVNMDRADAPGGESNLSRNDWFFEGDAAVIVPELLKSIIGDIARPSTHLSASHSH